MTSVHITLVIIISCIIPQTQSLEQLKNRYGAERIVRLLQEKAQDVLAFSWQMPFFTQGLGPALDAQAVRTAYEAYEAPSPWSDFCGFLSQHFRSLVTFMDRVLCDHAHWAPAAAVDLLRCFTSWAGPLNAARLRILLPMIVRHGQL
eukprot:582794-Amphidinium_carterae.1